MHRWRWRDDLRLGIIWCDECGENVKQANAVCLEDCANAEGFGDSADALLLRLRGKKVFG